jgi:hypothetical protein
LQCCCDPGGIGVVLLGLRTLADFGHAQRAQLPPLHGADAPGAFTLGLLVAALRVAPRRAPACWRTRAPC